MPHGHLGPAPSADPSGAPPGADADADDESPGEDLYATGATGALDMFALWAGESMVAAAAAAAEEAGDAGAADPDAAEHTCSTWGFVMRQLARSRALPGRLRGRLLWQMAQMRTDYASYLTYLASLTGERKSGH